MTSKCCKTSAVNVRSGGKFELSLLNEQHHLNLYNQLTCGTAKDLSIQPGITHDSSKFTESWSIKCNVSVYWQAQWVAPVKPNSSAKNEANKSKNITNSTSSASTSVWQPMISVFCGDSSRKSRNFDCFGPWNELSVCTDKSASDRCSERPPSAQNEVSFSHFSQYSPLNHDERWIPAGSMPNW